MANDVNIVIGAQDQASKILADVGKSTEKLAAQMSKASEQTSKTQKTFDFALKGFIAFKVAAMAATGAVKAVTASIAGMQASVEAFNTQEEAARGMTQAQIDFAASLQVATNVGDEATLGLLRQAEAMGATKDTSNELVTAAVGLAEAFGINQTEALKKVMQATNGNANALQELIPAIRTATTEEEKLALITQAAATGLEKLQADADTTKGAMERSAGAFGDLSEKIGALFAPIYKVTHTGLAIFAETLQTALGPAIDLVNNGFEGLQPYVDAFMEGMQAAAVVVGTAVEVIVSMAATFFNSFVGGVGQVHGATEFLVNVVNNMAKYIIQGLTIVEVAWNNFPTVVKIAVDSAMLFLEGLRADFAHTLTVSIPAYATWFANNFTNILSDGFNAAKTVITNFFTVASQLVTTGFEFISSGGKDGAIDFALALSGAISKPLLDGFEASTEALPDIAERSATEIERRLRGQIGGAASVLADDYAAKMKERMDRLNAELTPSLDLSLKDLEAKVDVKLGDQVTGEIQKISNSVQANSAVTGRLLTRGRDDSIQQKIAQQGAESNRLLEALRKATDGVKAAIEQKPVDQGVNVEVVA